VVSEPVERQIECLNEVAAVYLVGSMVLHMLEASPTEPPGEKSLKVLHQVLTFLLLERGPGQYRDCPTYIFETRADTGLTTISRVAPAPDEIESLMAKFFGDLADMWSSADALDVAAFAMWRICWIHPFKDNNGRTARAFAYVCLCLKMGGPLSDPGTFFNAALWQEGFYAVMLECHATFAAGAVDLSRMKDHLSGLLKLQAHVAGRRVAA
jgi:Fic family protein